MTELLRRFRELLAEEGSCRAFGLMRIGFALIVWTRYAKHMVLMQDLTTEGLARGVAFFVLTTLMLVGFRSRISTALVAALLWAFYYYWGLAQGREGWAHHHNYALAMGVTLLALTECGRSYSLDRWLALRAAARRKEPPPSERGPTWARGLLVLHLSVIYFFGALDKTTIPFLSGARMESYFVWFYWGFEYEVGGLMSLLMMLTAIVTVLLEYALALLAFIPRFRPYLLAGFYALLPVSTFSVTMVLMYLAYFPPDAIADAIARMHGHTAPDSAT